MRRLALALALIVPLAVILPVQAGNAGRAKRTCVVKGSKTVVRTSSARVYTRDINRGDVIQRLYGCLHSTNRKVLLDTSSDDGFGVSAEFRQVKLSGRYVAWEHVNTDMTCRAACPPEYDPTTEQIALADLRLRTRTGIPGTPRAGSLTVNRRGTVTWIDDPSGERRTYSVR